MKEEKIKEAIEKSVKTYRYWTIGITNDPKRRKDEHEKDGKNTKYWKYWQADTESIARRVEDYFLKKGMQGGGGGGEKPIYVYIF